MTASPRTDSGTGEGTPIATGVAWNIAALGFLALAGVVLNLVIGRFYGPDTLGVFNVAFAIYIFLSQIAVFGLQFSALHAVSVVERGDAGHLARTVYAGLLLCAGIACGVTVLALLATPFIVMLFPRVSNLSTAWLLVAPGLLPFALNKYMLGVINGLRHMRAYAVLQSCRFVGILLGLGLMVVLKAPGIYLTAILALAELLLLGLVGAYLLKAVPLVRPFGRWSDILGHLRFGLRVLPAGIVAELNTRVDILMMGALLNDAAVGVYTIAALIYEAALQGVVVIRNNISPQLARDIRAGRLQEILSFSRRLGLAVTALAAIGAAAAILLFPAFVGLVFPEKAFGDAAVPLFWLMLALVFVAAPFCYSLVLSQAGSPGWQSVGMTSMLLLNILFNAVLIPSFGIAGAAMATGLSTIIGGLIILVLSRFLLGIRIFF